MRLLRKKIGSAKYLLALKKAPFYGDLMFLLLFPDWGITLFSPLNVYFTYQAF